VTRTFRPLALLFAGLLPLLAPAARAAPKAPPRGQLTVHFFNVGQGDAALITSPTGKTVLVDGGPPEGGAVLERRLPELLGGRPVDLVILSHPHLDHLGGLLKGMKAVGAKRFLDPGFDHPSKSYSELLKWVGTHVGQVMNPLPNPEKPEELVTLESQGLLRAEEIGIERRNRVGEELLPLRPSVHAVIGGAVADVEAHHANRLGRCRRPGRMEHREASQHHSTDGEQTHRPLLRPSR